MKRFSQSNEIVPGSPYQLGDSVVVVKAIDIDTHDVSQYIGQQGVVVFLEYDTLHPGYPSDPTVGVTFKDGAVEEFWQEEIQACKTVTS